MGMMKEFDIRIRSGGDDAIAAVSELMAGRWIPVTERLPEPGVDVLVFLPKQSDIPRGVYFASLSSLEFLKGTFSTHFGFGFEATHWMPLPEPPN